MKKNAKRPTTLKENTRAVASLIAKLGAPSKKGLQRLLIAAERLLHNEGFLSESDRTRLWKRFDKAFTKGRWPTPIRDLGKR